MCNIDDIPQKHGIEVVVVVAIHVDGVRQCF
jgi:hypothetical protein